MGDLGQIVAEQVQRATFRHATAWEAVLRLHIKPRPRWMPEWCWRRLVALVLVQSQGDR